MSHTSCSHTPLLLPASSSSRTRTSTSTSTRARCRCHSFLRTRPTLPTQVVELLSAGADLSVRDNKGKGPMDLATKPETLDAMKQHSAAKK